VEKEFNKRATSIENKQKMTEGGKEKKKRVCPLIPWEGGGNSSANYAEDHSERHVWRGKKRRKSAFLLLSKQEEKRGLVPGRREGRGKKENRKGERGTLFPNQEEYHGSHWKYKEGRKLLSLLQEWEHIFGREIQRPGEEEEK